MSNNSYLDLDELALEKTREKTGAEAFTDLDEMFS